MNKYERSTTLQWAGHAAVAYAIIALAAGFELYSRHAGGYGLLMYSGIGSATIGVGLWASSHALPYFEFTNNRGLNAVFGFITGALLGFFAPIFIGSALTSGDSPDNIFR